jgi:hypothetical protein
MNHTVFTLEEFEVERLKALEALQCLVHTIMLSRALGDCTPRATECNTFPLTYAMAGDARGGPLKGTEAVDAALEQFLSRGLRPIGPHERRGCLRVVLRALSNRNSKGGPLSSSSLSGVSGGSVGVSAGGRSARGGGGGGGGDVRGVGRGGTVRGGVMGGGGGGSTAGHGSGVGSPAGIAVRRGEIFEEWCISVVVSETSALPILDAVSEAARKRKDHETMQAVRARVLFIAKEAAASETKLPDRVDGLGPFPYDLALDFDGQEATQKNGSESAISRGYLGLKSIARSFFG